MKVIQSTMIHALLACTLFATAAAQAQTYGPDITLDQARQVLSAAKAEAESNNWPVAIAIVDTAGNLVAFEKLDDTQTASVRIAQDKAVSAATFRRPTKVFQDAVASGGAGLRVLSLHNVSAAEGGEPIMVGGEVIGAIGVSGVTSEQDGIAARAGVAALE